MDDNDIGKTRFNMPPWHPETNSVNLKYLGKFAEEVSELGSAIARCIIQGISEREPVTKKLNKHWLEDEIADVYANAELVIEHFKLDVSRIWERAARKQDLLREWHDKA